MVACYIAVTYRPLS